MPLHIRAGTRVLATVLIALALGTQLSALPVRAQASDWLASQGVTKLQWLALVLQAGRRQAVCWKRVCRLEATFEVANDSAMDMLFIDVVGFNVSRAEVRQETMNTLQLVRVIARNVFDMAPPPIYLKESQSIPGKPFSGGHFTCTLPKAPPPSEPIVTPSFEHLCKPAK